MRVGKRTPLGVVNMKRIAEPWCTDSDAINYAMFSS